MTWNRQQFVNAVLLDLNVISLNEAPSDEDYDALSKRLDTLVADLQARGKLYLPDLDEIPDELVESLRDLTVMRLGPSYGRAPTALADILIAEDRVKAVGRPPATRRTLSTDPLLRQGAHGNRFNGRICR
jgi:hypothetical protein